MALGISVPKFWAGLMGRVIGARTAERLCLVRARVHRREFDMGSEARTGFGRIA